MGGFGGFNFDVDEILRLQEEEARRQQEAAAQGDYASMFADWNAGDQAAWEAYSPAGTTLTNFEMFSPGGYGALQGPEGETWQEAAARAAGAVNPQDPGFMDWQGQVAPGALERNSDLTNYQLANQGGWIQPQINYPSDNLSLEQKQAYNQLDAAGRAELESFLGTLAPAPAPAPAATAAPAAETDEEILARFLDSLSPEAAPGSAPGGINLMGDLMGDPSLGYTMDPSGYRVNADGYIVDPEGNVTAHTPYSVSQQDPAGFMQDYRFKDERPGMRQDAYDQALADGFTTGQIDEFLGNVGTEDWFNYLQGQEDVNALYGDEITEALTRIEETGTATLPWVDSPEFAAKYGDPTGEVPAGEVPAGEVPAGEVPAGEVPAGEVPAGGDVWADPFGDDETPPGVPVYVNEQVDAINIVRNQLKDIKDAHKKLLDSGLANIDEVEQALTDAESDIYAKQYGVLGPDGELLSPGEMDRLLSTWDARRSTSKKNRTTDRAEILSIMTDEGVPAGLAKSELDMIQAIHGDSVDAQYDYIDSLWRIGKMSHDERTSMIGNMMASYRLQLRDTLVEMIMGEEISAAEEIGDIRQTALQADTMADLFEGMSENEVFALMSSGMSDLLQLPEDDAIGMISDGEWAGYTSGQKANALLNAGYVQGADGLWTAPADEEAEELTKIMPDGTTFTGTADEYYNQYGTYIYADTYGDDEITKDLPDGTSFTGTVADYVARSGVYPFAAATDKDDPKKFTVSVDRINELDPTGAWLQGQVDAGNLTIIGARPDRREAEGASGFVTMDWDDWIFAEEPYEAAFETITKPLPDGTPFTGTVDEYFDRSGQYPFADPGAEDRILSTLVEDDDGIEQPWRGTAQQFLEEYGRHIFAEPDWRDEILETSVMNHETGKMEPWKGTADAYFDQHGLYIFGEEIDAPVPVPSGIKVADFPELKDAFEDIKIVDDEYWLSPSDSAVYHEIIEMREADPSTRGADVGGWMIDGPYEDMGVNWPVDALAQVQQKASSMAQDNAYRGFAAADLSVSAILANAGTDGRTLQESATHADDISYPYVFSRLAAKYLQKDIPIYIGGVGRDPNDQHLGYISHETGRFVSNTAYTGP